VDDYCGSKKKRVFSFFNIYHTFRTFYLFFPIFVKFKPVGAEASACFKQNHQKSVAYFV